MDWFLYNWDVRHERSLSTCTESLFLHVVKHDLFFLFFCSIWLLFHKYSRFTGQQVKWEFVSLYLFYHFHPLHRHLDIIWVIVADRLPLRMAGSRNRTWDLWHTLFRIHSFYTALLAAVVRKILKTRVTLGNISRTLLNKTKRLIFLMFKDSSSLSMFTQLTFIFSL